eukprot:GHVR01143942.1.p1 GENE.GHVR01143942.1~~GHVR01143942.1.p1  ORF type:complete len:642 (-),score=185.24 GHVR01143942.1:24-1838(-)
MYILKITLIISTAFSTSFLKSKYVSPNFATKEYFGQNVLRRPDIYRDLSHSSDERKALGIDGLLPGTGETTLTTLNRFKNILNRQQNNIQKYLFLEDLHNKSENLYFQILCDNFAELAPIVYTPTVGEACLNYSNNWTHPRGLYIGPQHKGRISDILSNISENNIKVIVVTDGSRVLGLGDLGANGMPISIGKLALYTAASGIHPQHTLPVMLDTGTNNKSLLNDPLYIGNRHKRVSADDLLLLVDEFVDAAYKRWPSRPLIQWEDFSGNTAFDVLHRHRWTSLSFNDDIQGTAGVILAGLFGALRIKMGSSKFDSVETREALWRERIVVVGAGAAGLGFIDMAVKYLIQTHSHTHTHTHTTEEELEELAKERFWVFNSSGLLTHTHTHTHTNTQGVLKELKKKYSRGNTAMNLMEVIRNIKPTILIGLSGQGGLFTSELISFFTANCPAKRPIIFALSNPTSNAECTALDAYTYSDGNAIFASGSPFEPVLLDGTLHIPGQGNNMYIFPAVGLATTVCGMVSIPDELFIAAAEALAHTLTQNELQYGTVYPHQGDIRQVVEAVAVSLVAWASNHGLAGTSMNEEEALTAVKQAMWHPEQEASL